MANFPASLDNGSSLPTPSASNNTNSPSHAALHGSENAAIIATETKLGTGATTPAANQLLVGTGAGTSAWQGLTSAQLLAILSDETGTGSAVFATTPTLVTPKVDTINEATPGNGVTVSGVGLKSGVITGSGAGLTSNTVPGTSITNNSITGQQVNWSGTGVNSGIWWEELGRTVLGGASGTMSLTPIAARKYLQIYISALDTGGTINATLRFNNDSASNYISRSSIDGTADGVGSAATSMGMSATASANPKFIRAEVLNIATVEKLVYGQTVERGAAGTGTSADRAEVSNKWVNTTTQITRVDIVNTGTGNFATGSELIVLGHN